MVAILRQLVKVERGGIIRVQSSELREGAVAEVVITTETSSPPSAIQQTWASFIGAGAASGRLVEEIDASTRALRDEWSE